MKIFLGRGHDGHGHFGQNRFLLAKNPHYNINIIFIIIVR